MKKLLLISLLLVCACKPTKIPKRFWPLIKSDTVTQVDTTVRVDTSYKIETLIDTVFDCKDSIPVIQKNKTGAVRLTPLGKGKFSVKADCKTYYILKTRTVTKTRTITKSYPINKPDWWDWYVRNWWFVVGIFAALVFGLRYIFKLIFT